MLVLVKQLKLSCFYKISHDFRLISRQLSKSTAIVGWIEMFYISSAESQDVTSIKGGFWLEAFQQTFVIFGRPYCTL